MDFARALGAPPVMARVFLQIFAKISPTTADADHYALASLAHETHKEFNWWVASAPHQMVELDVRIALLPWAG